MYYLFLKFIVDFVLFVDLVCFIVYRFIYVSNLNNKYCIFVFVFFKNNFLNIKIFCKIL